MTLRELGWMVQSRQKSEWFRTGIIAAAAKTALGGKFRPLLFIPPSLRPEAEPPKTKTKAEKESESRLAWLCLDRYFGGKGWPA